MEYFALELGWYLLLFVLTNSKRMKPIICGLVFSLGLLCASCRVNVKPIDGNGTIIQKEIAITDYRVISVAGNKLQVEYTRSDETPRLSVECDENLLSLVKIHTSHDTLFIEPEEEGFLMNPTRFVVQTCSSDIETLNMAGDVLFDVLDSLAIPRLALNMAGKCHARANALDIQHLTLNIAGKCQTDLYGKAGRVELNLAGQCDYDALNLQTRELLCRTAGSCSLHVFVTDKIDLKPVGVCNLYYKGDRDFNITYNRHSAILSPFNFNIRNFSLDIGMRWDYYDYTTMLSNVENEQVETVVDGGHFISYYAGVRYNSENKWHFPTRGSRFNATYSYNTDNFVGYGGSRGYSILGASWRTALPLTRRFTLQPMLYGRMLFGGTIPLCSANIIGGDRFGSYVEQQMPFAGMGHAEHIDNQFVAMQLSAYQRIATNNYVLLKLAAACISHKPADLLREPLTAGCQLAYYYNSMFGPLGGSLGWSNRTRGVYFYINLGFGF